MRLGLTQLRYSATQRRFFACGSKVLIYLLCAVFLRYAQKNCTPLKSKVPLCRRLNRQLRKSYIFWGSFCARRAQNEPRVKWQYHAAAG
jgi:hypothetical protein